MLQSENHSRSITADLLKGIAVIFMIQVHLTELFALPSLSSSPFGKLSLFLGGPPTAPVFMAVMGYFLFLSNKTRTQKAFRGLKLILGGLLLNIGLNAHLLFLIFTGHSALSPYHYIFGVDILLLAGLSTVIISMIDHILKRHWLVPLILSFCFAALSSFSHMLYTNTVSPFQYILACFGGTYEWSYFPIFPWMAYVLAGYSFAALKQQNTAAVLKQSYVYILLCAWLIFILLTGRWAVDISWDLPQYYHHSLLFYSWALVFIAGYAFVISKLTKENADNKILKYIGWIGKYVTVFYVFQWLIIGNIATAIYQSQNEIQLTAWFIAILAATTVLTYEWERCQKLVLINLKKMFA